MLGEREPPLPKPPSFLPLIPGCHGDPQQSDPHQLQLVAHLSAGERCGQACGGPRRAPGSQPRPLAQGEPGSVPLDPVLQLAEGTAGESRETRCARWLGRGYPGELKGSEDLARHCRVESGVWGQRTGDAGLLSLEVTGPVLGPRSASPNSRNIHPHSLPAKPSLLEG